MKLSTRFCAFTSTHGSKCWAGAHSRLLPVGQGQGGWEANSGPVELGACLPHGTARITAAPASAVVRLNEKTAAGTVFIQHLQHLKDWTRNFACHSLIHSLHRRALRRLEGGKDEPGGSRREEPSLKAALEPR